MDLREKPWWQDMMTGFFFAAGGYGFYKLIEAFTADDDAVDEYVEEFEEE